MNFGAKKKLPSGVIFRYDYKPRRKQSVEIVAGSITKEKVDVIVNSTRPDLNLSAEGLSGIILQAAGDTIQDECSAAGTRILPGHIHQTSAGKLRAKCIFHSVLIPWAETGSLEVLQQVLHDCLEQAHERGFKAIAFPALGTGGRGIPPKFCARVILGEVANFVRRHKMSTLRKIRIVLNPPDTEIIQVFEAFARTFSSEEDSEGDDLAETITDGITYPDYWSKQAHSKTATDQRQWRRIDIKPSRQEYKNIKRDLLADGVTNEIQKIERIENRSLYQAYAVQAAAMKKTFPQKQLERILYHGTRQTAVDEIILSGFNRSYSGTANAALFGNGSYFAVNPSYSANDKYSTQVDGSKYLFRCRVLTGDFCKGSDGMVVPPRRPKGDRDKRFHSVVNNVENPSIFVIFQDAQAYPDYLIELAA